MTAPAVYRDWWAKTEACSGIRADFERIRWYRIEGTDFECPSGRCAGRWQRDGRIILAEDWTLNELVVRHEMLHALIGEPGHPEGLFDQACRLTWESWASEGPSAARAPIPFE